MPGGIQEANPNAKEQAMNLVESKTPAMRILAVLLTFILGMGAIAALSGCGANDEQVIRDGIAKELDAFKNPSKDFS